MRSLPILLSSLLLAGCGAADTPGTPSAPTVAAAKASATRDTTVAAAADVPEFPAIPLIVVPEILGVTPAQRALEASMKGALDPIQGGSIAPARCGTDGVLVNDAGITGVDAQGNLLRNGENGLFKINADGSGTINGSVGDGEIVRVQADGSGSYNGPVGLITLDGRGAGTWNGGSGLIQNNGDGSGTWNGREGLLTINADGSGTWNGEQGLIRNNGDGTGMIGTPGRKVAMAPLPKVPPAGRFPSLRKFAPPGAPCGYLITLNDRVLFDFDKSQIRADAATVLDTLATALGTVQARDLEVGGHTDSKGGDDYNQALSERRAAAVPKALRARGLALQASAKGYGESRPVAPNQLQGQDNPAGRQLNRRVEIFVRT
ncbi:OmpA family protein [Xanthomonas translucens]|uniref:OmpA family protein n=1 Tax=Xanthomonas campestris pv. translucens TaxID=343 RepID=UPI00071E6FF3|nr:OmpA family protein [Xanthomonas translucens]AVY66984.1 membrane protein [Xanthomonas translucens pv. undulosa]QEO26281.1 OmpA family protein [Xanthomonas translucens pv. undulosa]QSQ53879.1 OmpA family protein [Xanthomonas translucens pv. undulosa]QSQ60501.1 OmpA family protein [Xanthomonas translucens pv. undulosa]UPU47991.1 OmpA family protein [Xanthomonas translucens pv. undulosa]